ncbi:MAG: Deoxyhypusine synthase [Watsoniomyces obsoletus]|nr:MAG: Deoxyhypusine synthase [Watsoniomyces obsoletus]
MSDQPSTGATTPPSTATDAILRRSDGIPPGLMSDTVRGVNWDQVQQSQQPLSVNDLVEAMAHTGFQATSVAEAVRIINDMLAWRHPESGEGTTIVLGYTSNMISSGLRDTFRYLVQHRKVSAIVTTAGGIEEDLIKCLAPTYVGSFNRHDGASLRRYGVNRIGNLYVPNDNYCAFEDWLLPRLDRMLDEQEVARQSHTTSDSDSDSNMMPYWTPSKVIAHLGREINDPESVYYWAAKNDIPVFCPALTDGSLGDMLYFHTYRSSPRRLQIDIIDDIRHLNDFVLKAKRVGIVVLGAGLVKHHIANACLFHGGAESAVYVNTAQEYDGSDAGARPDEAVSWGKIKIAADAVKVHADATIVFPMIVACTFAKQAVGVGEASGVNGSADESKTNDKSDADENDGHENRRINDRT